jgi:prefoldin subunit 5
MPGWIRSRWGAMPPAAADPAMEKQYLEQQAQDLQAQIDLIRKRLSEIQPSASD